LLFSAICREDKIASREGPARERKRGLLRKAGTKRGFGKQSHPQRLRFRSSGGQFVEWLIFGWRKWGKKKGILQGARKKRGEVEV